MDLPRQRASKIHRAKAPPSPAPKSVLPGRYVAYLFDDIHTKPGDLLQGRQAANRQLDRSLDADTRVGIFTTSGRTTQDFTGDTEKLRAALNRIQRWERGLDNGDCPNISHYLADLLVNKEQSLSPGLSDNTILGLIANDPMLSAVIQEAEVCLHSTFLQYVLSQVRVAAQRALSYGRTESVTGLSTLRDLIGSMSTMPGSRRIVMVSPGFLFEDEHRIFENDILEKAIHASVTINTLDVRGLATIGAEASERGSQSNFAGLLMQAQLTAASKAQDLLAELAAGTGGTFFGNDNAFVEGLQELAARPEYTYISGFSPENLKFDGSYHWLKVTVKSGASLKIDARRGYWAPNHAVDAAERAKEEIQDAVSSLAEVREISVDVTTDFFKSNDSNAELTVEAHLGLNGLKFKTAGDRNENTLTVVTALIDQNGRYCKQHSEGDRFTASGADDGDGQLQHKVARQRGRSLDTGGPL